MSDYPQVRNSIVCPLCHGHKDNGLIACWPCYRKRGLRYCEPKAEAIIAKEEARLTAIVIDFNEPIERVKLSGTDLL